MFHFQNKGGGEKGGVFSRGSSLNLDSILRDGYGKTVPNSILVLTVGVLIFGFIVITFFERQKRSELVADELTASLLLVLRPEVSIKTFQTASFDPVGVDERVEVVPGMEVRVGDQGEAVLLYPNGTLSALGSGAHVAIDELAAGGKTSYMRLLAGSMWARVERVFGAGEVYEVESGNFVTSVRGTEFDIVAHEDGTATLSVLGNTVSLRPLDDEFEVEVGAGESLVISSGKTSKEKLNQSKSAISLSALEDIVVAHRIVDETLEDPAVRGRAAKVLGELVSSGTTPESALYGFERAIEAIGTLGTFSRDARALRHLALADERLAEARALVQGGASAEAVLRALENYDRALTKVLEGSKQARNPNTSEIVARATGKHAEVLDRIIDESKEEARPFVRSARANARVGHVAAIETLAGKDPLSALAVSAESMNQNLREAQTRATLGDGLNTFDALENYDRLVRLGGSLQKNDVQFAEKYADEVGKALKTIETVNALASSLPSGYKNTVMEVRDRSVKNHIASIATVASENPEAAVSLFADTSDFYLKTVRSKIDQGERAGAAEIVSAYEQYADFGAEVAGLARELKQGEATVQDLVEKATSHHRDVLRDVVSRVPEVAKDDVVRAISNIEKIQTGAVERIEPETLKEERGTPPQFENLESPVTPPSAVPLEQQRRDVAPSPTTPNGTQTPTAPTIPQRPETPAAPNSTQKNETAPVITPVGADRGNAVPTPATPESDKGKIKESR